LTGRIGGWVGSPGVFKFLVEKLPDFGPVPALGVFEIRIKFQIAGVKLP